MMKINDPAHADSVQSSDNVLFSGESIKLQLQDLAKRKKYLEALWLIVRDLFVDVAQTPGCKIDRGDNLRSAGNKAAADFVDEFQAASKDGDQEEKGEPTGMLADAKHGPTFGDLIDIARILLHPDNWSRDSADCIGFIITAFETINAAPEPCEPLLEDMACAAEGLAGLYFAHVESFGKFACHSLYFPDLKPICHGFEDAQIGSIGETHLKPKLQKFREICDSLPCICADRDSCQCPGKAELTLVDRAIDCLDNSQKPLEQLSLQKEEFVREFARSEQTKSKVVDGIEDRMDPMLDAKLMKFRDQLMGEFRQALGENACMTHNMLVESIDSFSRKRKRGDR